MQPSWRLALNTLAGRPGRTALMIGAVAIAAALVVAMSCTIGSAQASMELGVTKVLGGAHARIIHPFNGRFSEDVLALARSWPEVKSATGRLGTALTLVHADHRKDAATGELIRSTPNALGMDFELEQQYQKPEVTAGRLPRSPDEILLDPIAAAELKAQVGDRLEVQRFGDPVPLRVAGIYGRKRLSALQRPALLIDRGTLQAATGRTGQLTSILMILKDSREVSAFCARHAGEIPPALSLEPAEMIRAGLNRQIAASRFGFTIASILTFMCASFIIVTALTTSVTERQRDMAVVRCIGAARHQLFASQVIVGACMAALGAAAGIPLGIGLAAGLVWWFRDLLPAGFSIHPLGIQLALIGAAASGVLGAIYPAFMASRVSPMQAMAARAKPPRRSSLVWCAFAGLAFIGLQLALLTSPDPERRFLSYVYAGMPAVHIGYFLLAVPLLGVAAMPLGGVLGAALRLPRGMLGRSLLGSPFRNGFTAGALMVGIAILVSTWAGMTSIMHDWIGKIRFADGFAYKYSGISKSEQEAIARLPEVSSVCPIGYVSLRVIGRQIFGVQGLAPPNVTCFGFEPDRFFAMNAVEWAAGDPAVAIPRLKDGTGILVADRFLTTQKVKIGDRITLGSGRVEKEFEIVGAVNSAGLDIATQSFGIRSQYMEVSISAVFMDFRTLERVFDFHDVIMLQTNLKGPIDDKAMIKRVADAAPGVAFTSGRWIMETVNEIAAAILTVQSTIAFAALVLACLGAGNVILANIHGRRYEFGVLRAVGGGRSMLARLILGEAAILALAAALVGTALGVHLAWVGAIHYRGLAGLPIQLRFPAAPTAIGALVLLVMTLLAALPGVRSVVRGEPRRLLAAGRNG